MPLCPTETGPKRSPARASADCQSSPDLLPSVEFCSCQKICTADSCPDPVICAKTKSGMPLCPTETGPKRSPARASADCQSSPDLLPSVEFCSCQKICTADSCPDPVICAKTKSEGRPHGFTVDNEDCRVVVSPKPGPPPIKLVATNSSQGSKFEDICCHDQQRVPDKTDVLKSAAIWKRCSETCPNSKKKQSLEQANFMEKTRNLDETNIVLKPLTPESSDTAKVGCCASGGAARGGRNMRRGHVPLKTLISEEHMLKEKSMITLITVDRLSTADDAAKPPCGPTCSISGILGKEETLEAEGSSSCPRAALGLVPPTAPRPPCLCRMPPAFTTVCTGNLSGTCPCASCNK